MPQLKPIDIRAYDKKDGTDWKYKADCWVRGEDGVFVAHVHADIVPAALELARTPGRTQDPSVHVYESSTRWLASAPTLQGLKDFLTRAAQAWHSGTTETTRVIRFIFDARASFWLSEAGSIHSNGAGHEGHGGKWWVPKTTGAVELHATSRSPVFTLGLAARVFDKVVTTRTSGTTTRFHRAKGEYGDAISLLNGWVGLDEDAWPTQMVREIPYTPEAALFFHNTLVSLCRVIERFDSFFADTGNVLAAAETGQFLLPPVS